MQMRFDGTLGFPGGHVDAGETPEQAISREFTEVSVSVSGVGMIDVSTHDQETGYCGLTFTGEDHVATHTSENTMFCLHFFARQVM